MTPGDMVVSSLEERAFAEIESDVVGLDVVGLDVAGFNAERFDSTILVVEFVRRRVSARARVCSTKVRVHRTRRTSERVNDDPSGLGLTGLASSNTPTSLRGC